MGPKTEDAALPLYPLSGAVPAPVPLRREAPVVAQEYVGSNLQGIAAALAVDRELGLGAGWVRLDLRRRCAARVSAPEGGLWLGSREDCVSLSAAAPNEGLWVDAGVAGVELWSLAEGVPFAGILADPHGALARGGGLGIPVAEVWPALRETCGRPGAPRFLSLASGTPYHDAGATAAQELGATLASVVEVLREVGDAVWPRLVVQLCVDTDVFVSTAKIRAARWLLAAIGRRAGLLGLPRCSVRTAWRNRTRHDEGNNLVRATLEVFAGAVGGADELVVQPHSQARGAVHGDARRWALGVQHVLLLEGGVAAVADPTRGAPYVEALTTAIARDAWSFTQEIERLGGLLAALCAGDVQARVEAAAAQTRTAMAEGTEVLTGVNLYRDPKPLLAAEVVPLSPRDLPEPSCTAQPLAVRRFAEPFEVAGGGQG